MKNKFVQLRDELSLIIERVFIACSERTGDKIHSLIKQKAKKRERLCVHGVFYACLVNTTK